MGVRGLKTFIEGDKRFLNGKYHLYDCSLIIDANNLMVNLIRVSQGRWRADLFGSDLIKFAKCIDSFFDNLKKCNIKPILVFDGAQPADECRDKFATKLIRCRERFYNVMKVNVTKSSIGVFVVPALTVILTKSIACSLGIKIVQAMYEADDEIARQAHIYKGPVLSSDSDFYLFDLPAGLISLESLEFRKVNIASSGYRYISCDLFIRAHFVKCFPGLDPQCLPLAGVLLGNDFTHPLVLKRIDYIYSNLRCCESRQDKILKMFHALSGRSLGANIDYICQSLSADHPEDLKRDIEDSLRVYKIPEDDLYFRELARLTRDGYYSMHAGENPEAIESQFRAKLKSLTKWLKNSLERSVLIRRALEIIHRNIIFIRPFMDDLSLPNAHLCQKRCLEVMLQLTRIAPDDMRPCEIYDRVYTNYSSFLVYPISSLDGFGPLNYTLLDIPTLSQSTRRRILFSTFSCKPETFEKNLTKYKQWFDEENAREFLTIKTLFDYIDKVSSVKLWKSFKRSTLACYIYYLAAAKRDLKFSSKLANPKVKEFICCIREATSRKKIDLAPPLKNSRFRYNSRIMHQISQLHTSFYNFNMLNAFLSCPSTLLKLEHWLNSCFIYNFTDYHQRLKNEFQALDKILN